MSLPERFATTMTRHAAGPRSNSPIRMNHQAGSSHGGVARGRWPAALLAAVLLLLMVGAFQAARAQTRSAASTKTPPNGAARPAPAQATASAAAASAPAGSVTSTRPSSAAQTQSADARDPLPVELQRNPGLDLSSVLPNLTRQPLRFASTGRPMAEVQRQLEPSLGVRLILTGSLADLPVTGEFGGNDGLGFIRDMASKLRLDWAVGRDGIYLAPEGATRTVLFTAPSTTVAFRAASLANQEFEQLGTNVRVVARREEITVTGIPVWLNQVAALRIPALVDFVQRTMAQQAARAQTQRNAEQAEAARREAAERSARTGAPTASSGSVLNLGAGGAGNAGEPAEPMSLMVFRLNNAYVDDKRLSVGSNSVQIPGVATLFRQFTGLGTAPTEGVQGGASGSGDSLTRLSRVEPLAGGRPGTAGREEAPAASRGAAASAGVAANQPAVIADSRMNALIVRDRASMLETYRSLIKVLDQPTDMVQLDAFVIDIKASRLDEFGLGLSWTGSAASSGTGGTGGSGSQVPRALLPGGTTPNGANVILQAARGVQLLAQVRALETTGDSELLTVPSVVTLNNLEATFSARQNFFVKVSGNQDASVTRVTAETLLRVTPLVAQTGGRNGSDRRIRLLISIQDGSVDASAAATVDNLPRTLENQISTQAVVRGGDTLVIGGQVVRKRVNRVSGLPFIRNIPILGTLTNSRSDDYEQYVRVYVVRPRLLGEDSSEISAPVGPEGPDPASHRVLEQVPALIRGSGLTPRRAELAVTPPSGGDEGPFRSSEATPTVVPMVVPVPAPVRPAPLQQPTTEPQAPPVRGKDRRGESSSAETDEEEADNEEEAKGARTRSSQRSSGETADRKNKARKEESNEPWDPADPMWRPPGSPLGRPLTMAPTPAEAAVGRGAPAATAESRVEPVTQAARDRDARRILESELARAERAVARLEQEVAQGGASVRPALDRARADVESIRAELARLGVTPPTRSTATSR